MIEKLRHEGIDLESLSHLAKGSTFERIGQKLSRIVDVALNVKPRSQAEIDQLTLDLIKERGLSRITVIPSSEGPPLFPLRTESE